MTAQPSQAEVAVAPAAIAPDPSSSSEQVSFKESHRRVALVRDFSAQFGVVGFLVILTVVFCVLLPSTFATTANFKSMVNTQAVLLLLAATATVVLRVGDFDLSIAQTMTLSGAVVAMMSTNGWSVWTILIVTVLLGLVIGGINGFLVVKIGVDSFIATIGMSTALTGLAYWVSNSSVISGIPDNVTRLAQARLFGFPIATFYGWGLIVVLWYLYEKTPLGRYLLFIGGGRDVARLAGVQVDSIRIGCYMLSSVLAALIGIVLVGNIGSMDPSIGGQYLLQPFAAAYIGATTIKLGRFNAFGTLVGLYLLTVGITGLQLYGASPWVSDFFNGVALVAAVTLARVAGRKK